MLHLHLVLEPDGEISIVALNRSAVTADDYSGIWFGVLLVGRRGLHVHSVEIHIRRTHVTLMESRWRFPDVPTHHGRVRGRWLDGDCVVSGLACVVHIGCNGHRGTSRIGGRSL